MQPKICECNCANMKSSNLMYKIKQALVPFSLLQGTSPLPNKILVDRVWCHRQQEKHFEDRWSKWYVVQYF